MEDRHRVYDDRERMEVIQQRDKRAQQILGQQEQKEGAPRFLNYCVAAPCDEGLLLHNVLTKELLLLVGAEAALLHSDALNASAVLRQSDSALFSYLYAHWFIVPHDHDDGVLCRSLRAVARQLYEVAHGSLLTSFTILTTTVCNARCFYCYERGCNYEDMSSATAERVVAFIARSCGRKAVALHWFGGEPLCNTAAIDIITRGLQEEGIAFHSTMTTNGYLFDEALISRAKEQWHLRKVQVTLDGTEEVYNRRKAYVYKGVNAFARVTDNVECLLRQGIAVVARLNFDAANHDDLLSLSDYLSRRYGRYRRFSAYGSPLFHEKEGRYYVAEAPLRRDYMAAINARLPRDGRGQATLNGSIVVAHCMADNAASVVIQPSGTLGKCQHFLAAHACGTIDKGLCAADEVERCKEVYALPAACYACPAYPDCLPLVVCPYTSAKSLHTSLACTNTVSTLRQEMLATYSKQRKPRPLPTVAPR